MVGELALELRGGDEQFRVPSSLADKACRLAKLGGGKWLGEVADYRARVRPPTLLGLAGSIGDGHAVGLLAPSVVALLAGPPLPSVPLVVVAATNHDNTREREALWRDVQRRTAALSPKGRLTLVESGHFVQIDRPEAVVGAVLIVAAEAGANVSACQR